MKYIKVFLIYLISKHNTYKMPTICELQIEAKKRGLRGYSKLKKAQLEALLNGKPSSVKKAPTPVKKAPTPVKTEKEAMDLITTNRNYDDMLVNIEMSELEALSNGRRLTEKQQIKLLEKASASAVKIANKSIKEFLKKNDWKKMDKKELVDKAIKKIRNDYF